MAFSTLTCTRATSWSAWPPRRLGAISRWTLASSGALTEFDKEYLAQNFTAFFRRDYKRVAEAAH